MNDHSKPHGQAISPSAPPTTGHPARLGDLPTPAPGKLDVAGQSRLALDVTDELFDTHMSYITGCLDAEQTTAFEEQLQRPMSDVARYHTAMTDLARLASGDLTEQERTRVSGELKVPGSDLSRVAADLTEARHVACDPDDETDVPRITLAGMTAPSAAEVESSRDEVRSAMAILQASSHMDNACELAAAVLDRVMSVLDPRDPKLVQLGMSLVHELQRRGDLVAADGVVGRLLSNMESNATRLCVDFADLLELRARLAACAGRRADAIKTQSEAADLLSLVCGASARLDVALATLGQLRG